MTDETIPPALTAEQWATVAKCGGPRQQNSMVGEDDSEAHFLVALNNAALPDGDPRKITRDDLEWFDDFADACHTPESREWHARFRAKLAALLPPEGT